MGGGGAGKAWRYGKGRARVKTAWWAHQHLQQPYSLLGSLRLTALIVPGGQRLSVDLACGRESVLRKHLSE